MTWRRSVRSWLLAVVLGSAAWPASAQQPGSVHDWLDEIGRALQEARGLAAQGDVVGARGTVIRTYLDYFEPLEAHYGPGAAHGTPALGSEVRAGEAAFHDLMRSADAAAFQRHLNVVIPQLNRIRHAVEISGVPLTPTQERATFAAHEPVAAASAATAEIRRILAQLEEAAVLYAAHEQASALARVENAYLEDFEPLESRLPGSLVDRIEKRIHLELRPAIRRGAGAATVTSLIGLVGADLQEADRFLARGANATFAAINSFVIILREGLEAVLLIAALIAYLAAIGAQARHRRQIYAGVVAGVVASLGTWFVARELLPISGANRELIEGITALIAVVVLMYVAHWLFQKTYIHDWKEYLRARVNTALTRGSALAMAGLAFAAVYREGFETVLFYQALAFDAGVGPILAGFIPGSIVIVGVGVGIIKLGVKLPLRRVFAFTNAVLLYLAFVFIGKGIYNLQEAGLFSPVPLSMPDHPALRQLLGFYPVAQTLAAQGAFLTLLAATYVWYRLARSAGVSAPGRQNVRPPAQPAVAPRAWQGNRRSRPEVLSADPPPARAPSEQ